MYVQTNSYTADNFCCPLYTLDFFANNTAVLASSMSAFSRDMCSDGNIISIVRILASIWCSALFSAVSASDHLFM